MNPAEDNASVYVCVCVCLHLCVHTHHALYVYLWAWIWGVCPLSSIIKGITHGICTEVSPFFSCRCSIMHELLRDEVCALYVYQHLPIFSLRMKPLDDHSTSPPDLSPVQSKDFQRNPLWFSIQSPPGPPSYLLLPDSERIKPSKPFSMIPLEWRLGPLAS